MLDIENLRKTFFPGTPNEVEELLDRFEEIPRSDQLDPSADELLKSAYV